MVVASKSPAGIDYVDPLVLMQRVADQALELVPGADGVLVGLRDDDCVTYVCGSGYLSGSLGVRTAMDSSIGGVSIRSGQVLRCDDTESDPRVDREVSRRLGTRSVVCVPLSRGAEIFGVLAVGGRSPSMFDDGDVSNLEGMAELISVTVGIAEDCSRVSAELARIAKPGVGTGRCSDHLTSDSAGRFVMNVIDPRAAMLADGRRRVEDVLGGSTPLSLVFQPIVDLASGEVVAVEALSRFGGSPQRPPDVWFAEAHQSGLGTELEMLAVTRALACLSALPDGVAMTFNVGPQTILSPEFLDALSGAHDTARVVVELTEHAVVEDYPELAKVILRLRTMGTRLAVDDTGAGFASLAHILKLAPDFIKLDRELVTGIDLDPIRRALATALVSFAAETGARILAEGIESEDELDVVRRLGASYAQGFYLGRPDTLEVLLAKRASPSAPACG
jgi:EAL domain-containing protein (putative c-di-GMP-specific phosphodiesterase class I)